MIFLYNNIYGLALIRLRFGSTDGLGPVTTSKTALNQGAFTGRRKYGHRYYCSYIDVKSSYFTVIVGRRGTNLNIFYRTVDIYYFLYGLFC